MLLTCNECVSKITSALHIFNSGCLTSGNVCLHEQGCEDPWLFFEAKRGPRRRKCGQYCTTLSVSRWKRLDKERKKRKKRGKRRAIAIGRTPKMGDKWMREKGGEDINVKLGRRRGMKWVRVAIPYVLENYQIAGFLILNKHVGIVLRSYVCAGVWNWLLRRISFSSTDSNKWREFPLNFQQSTALWPWGRLSLLQKWVPGKFPGG